MSTIRYLSVRGKANISIEGNKITSIGATSLVVAGEDNDWLTISSEGGRGTNTATYDLDLKDVNVFDQAKIRISGAMSQKFAILLRGSGDIHIQQDVSEVGIFSRGSGNVYVGCVFDKLVAHV
jgi:hypothetical protein